MEHPDKIVEQADTTVEESGQLDSFTIQRTTLNYIIIAAVFFALGGGMTLITTQPFAQANQDENQQLIEQAVAAVLDARNEPTAVQQVAQAAVNNRLDVGVDDDPTYGPDDAAVVIVEFSDFNCPYCGRFANETLPLLRDNYGDYVRFAYRDFPVLGDSSLQAAIAAECAGDQGAFWEFHDLLFANQGGFNQELFLSFAEQLTLNVSEFTACQNDETTREEVLADYAVAQRLGATGTPTFFINGVRVIGAQPYEVFATIIDEELALADSP